MEYLFSSSPSRSLQACLPGCCPKRLSRVGQYIQRRPFVEADGLPEPLQASEDEIIEDLEDETEIQANPRPQDSRNFEFVNAIGAALPNATSRPFIRSHVMREANRVTYSPGTGQSVGSSSEGGPQRQEPSQPQVQKFRISPSGLRPLLPSKRSRKGQNRSGGSSPSRLTEGEDYQAEVPQIQGADTNDLYDATDTMVQFASDPGLLELQTFLSDYTPNTDAQTLERGKIPVTSPVSSGPQIPIAVRLFTIGGEQMDPFNSLPIPSSHRTEILLHHCKPNFSQTSLQILQSQLSMESDEPWKGPKPTSLTHSIFRSNSINRISPSHGGSANVMV